MADVTPQQWRDKLLPRLVQRMSYVSAQRRWYDGPHPWPTAPSTTNDLYERFCRLAETNVCGLVVDAPMERLRVDGVRLSADPGADLDAWDRVWQRNQLDAGSVSAHEEALKVGSGYVLVWPAGDAGPQVTIEDALECIVAYEPGSRRVRRAALKAFTDPDAGEQVVTVWTPAEVVTWRRPVAESILAVDSLAWGRPLVDASGWTIDEQASGPHQFRAVPLVELNPRAVEISRSVVTIQQRINKAMFDSLVIGEYQAFRQRYAIGIEVKTDAEGNPVNPLQSGPERVWLLESDDPSTAKIGELAAADLSDHEKRIDGDIHRLAAVTKTPLYYVSGGLVNVSADAIRAAEAGLIAKCRNHQLMFGQSWEEVFRLALIADGQTPPEMIEMVWADPESRSLAERADAALKLRQAGYPFSAVARKMGETQVEIDRLVAEAGARSTEQELGELVQKVYLGVPDVVSASEARALLARAGFPLSVSSGP